MDIFTKQEEEVIEITCKDGSYYGFGLDFMEQFNIELKRVKMAGKKFGFFKIRINGIDVIVHLTIPSEFRS